MKFFALVAAASAVRLSSKNKNQDGPSAAQIIDYCDKSGDQMLSLKEVVDCIMPHAPQGVTRAEVRAYVKPLFDEADTSGDGHVDLDELRAALAAHGNALAKTKAEHPTPAEVIDACDTNESGGISRKEAHACIDAHISDPDMNKAAHQAVKKHFGEVDQDGNGEVDEHELSAAMQAHNGLAKLGVSPADIVEACDADESGALSKDEVHACIDAHVSDPEENKQAHNAVDAHFDTVDADGSGEVDEHELAAAMRAAHGLAKTKGMPSRQEIQHLVNHCDKNGDVELSVNEIARCF